MSVVIFVRMMPEPFFSYQYKFFFYDESALNMGDLAEKTIYIYIYSTGIFDVYTASSVFRIK